MRNKAGASKDEVRDLLEDIEDALDDSREADEVRLALKGIHRTHDLAKSPAEPVADFSAIMEDLGAVSAVRRPSRYSGGREEVA